MDSHGVRSSELGLETQLPWLVAGLERCRELAPSQRIVLGCLAAGMDIRTTATHLSRSEHTIKSHTTTILQRLGVNSRLQAGIVGHHLVLRGELDLPKCGSLPSPSHRPIPGTAAAVTGSSR